MKKVLKWMGIAVLTPLLLFIILAALLYLPPVQNWVVQKVTAIASEKTGMEISIGHVNLEFPLDLGIDDFRVLHQNDSVKDVTDTIADIKKMVIDVKLLPLLQKRARPRHIFRRFLHEREAQIDERTDETDQQERRKNACPPHTARRGDIKLCQCFTPPFLFA